MQVTVIVDAFRAFATASYVLQQEPACYAIATNSTVLTRLTTTVVQPFFIGKLEKDANSPTYAIPNSPTRVKELDLKGKHVYHRTAAGAKGILEAQDADIVLAAAFTNAEATACAILRLGTPKVSIIPMGHEGTAPSQEDTLCAEYLAELLKGEQSDISSRLLELKEGPGRYFFSDDQWQYPSEDFTLCTQLNQVDFAIHADVKDDYAILTKFPANDFNDKFCGTT